MAWLGSYEATAERAAELLPSGLVRWGLDDDRSIFSAFEIPGQPATVLVAQGVEIGRWFGARGEDGIREAFENLSRYS